MVCDRCIMVVRTILEKEGIQPVWIRLGEVELNESEFMKANVKVRIHLQKYGFDLLDDDKTRTIEKVKNLIVELVHNGNNQLKITLSEFLSGQLHKDYSGISNLFSEVEGITIEKYYINQKIEKVKELLVYDELSLSEIAFQLNYSSVAYLSNQFKKVTGLTPTHFKNIGSNKRKGLDRL